MHERAEARIPNTKILSLSSLGEHNSLYLPSASYHGKLDPLPWKGRISLLVPSIFLYCASENYVCFRNNIFHFSFKIQVISSLC